VASADDTSPTKTADVVAMIAQLQAEHAGFKAEMAIKVTSLQDTITNLSHENALLKRRLYGNKTERSLTSELQLALGDLLGAQTQLAKELEQKVDEALNAAPPAPEGGKGTGKPHGRRDLALLEGKLPRVVVEITDEQMEVRGRRIGFEESRQFAYRPGGLYILVKRTAKYEMPANASADTTSTPAEAANASASADTTADSASCEPQPESPPVGAAPITAPAATAERFTTVVTTETPPTLFPKGLLHTSAIAHLLISKFALGTPHYRLEQALADQGVPLDRGLMCRYVEHAGNTLGATIVAAMWRDAIANGGVISTDATGALIQPTERKAKDRPSRACKKGHFFTAVVDLRAVLFQYVERHTSDAVKDLFGEFRGVLQSDASAVYNILDRGPPKDGDDTDGVTLVGCWAHCRRYFYEAALCRHAAGIQGLLRIRAIFAVERAERRVPPSERTAYRREHMAPLIDELFAWVKAARETMPGNNLATKAIGYTLNQEAELRRVLLDAQIPLDNTRAERALRKIVVGRKNWMFYGSDTHAEAAAAIFSLIASCRLHRLDPFVYFDEVLRVLPYWPRERYLELAPDHWATTRARLDQVELASPISSFTVPPEIEHSAAA
jgi:transposase